MASTPITILNASDPTSGIDPNGAQVVPSSGGQVDTMSLLPTFTEGFMQSGNLLNQTNLQSLNSFWTKLQEFVNANPQITVIAAIFLLVMVASPPRGRGR